MWPFSCCISFTLHILLSVITHIYTRSFTVFKIAFKIVPIEEIAAQLDKWGTIQHVYIRKKNYCNSEGCFKVLALSTTKVTILWIDCDMCKYICDTELTYFVQYSILPDTSGCISKVCSGSPLVSSNVILSWFLYLCEINHTIFHQHLWVQNMYTIQSVTIASSHFQVS